MNKLYISKKNTKELLDYVLKDNNITSKIIYNEYGKPYLENSNLFFNLSHSIEYTVCILSDKEIGIDIEKICFKEKVMNKVFNNNEICNNSLDFTRIWVLKEAFVKKIGIGLSYGLINVDTTKLVNYRIIRYKDYVIGIVF